jgi:dihydroorotase
MGSSTGSLLVADDEPLRNILRHGRRRIAVHCEDEPRLIERWNLVKDGAPVHMHPVWRDEETALRATMRLVRLAEETRRRVHVLHISTAEELAILEANRDIATCEVLPNHLTLAAPECYERLGTHAQQNPPIREQRHQDALWSAVRNGLIDILGSDHAPHTLEEKAKTYPASPSGTPGVQTLVPIMLNHVHAGRLTLERFVDLTAYGPARVHQIAGKGRICPGYDADFTIVDLKAQKEITNKQQKSKSGWTPFDGMKVTGWPIATIIRGHIVMQDGEIGSLPVGAPVRFKETLGNELPRMQQKGQAAE